MASNLAKVSKCSVNDLKNATDDALAPYLTSLPAPYTFTQFHTHTNTRLALGYAAVTIAAITFYADWKLGWDATKTYTAAACLVYAVLNGALTWHIWKVEAGRVFVGRQKGGQTLTLQSSAEKFTPVYKLKVSYEAVSGQKWEDKEIHGTFMEWFDEDGHLQHAELKKWLARNIEVIGVADSNSKEGVDQSAATEAPVVVEASGQSSADGTSTVKGRKTKKKG